jgi:predicted Rossmann fold nucleotide-binding protein DprA/Smf involved in DNA uptake
MLTYREMLENVVAGNVNDEVIEKATERLAKLDETNAKRKNRVSKKAIENEPIKEAICEVLTDEPKTATVIGEEIGISTQKASALLRQLVEAERANKVDVKVKGKGVQKGYTL